jgi:septin family protein
MEQERHSEFTQKMLAPFSLPGNFLIVGESGSGKSFFMENLIKYSEVMFEPTPNGFIIIYNQLQPCYHEWQQKYKNVHLVHGIVKDEITKKLKENPFSICIYDDLMYDTIQSKFVADMFTAGRYD